MTQIFPLSEGTFTIGRDKIFHPFNEEKDELNDRPTGSLLVEVQPFAIVNDEDVILLDTGLGFNSPDGVAHLAENLQKFHIHPEDVTKVLLSHLHKDHAGGIDVQLFKNAHFYIHQKEWDYAFEIGFPSYYTEDLEQLKSCDRVVWLQEDAGEIAPNIHYEKVGGHCPEHLIFKIQSEEGLIFYGGDNAPQYKQMIVKYVAKYDYDGKKAMELRKEWAEKGAKENWRFLFYHDVKKPMAILTE